MPTTSSTYLNFCSFKSIEDQFIDECLSTNQTGIKSKQEFIETDQRLPSNDFISLGEISSEKLIGRWTVNESFIYVDVLRQNQNTKGIVKTLVERLPQRIESQVRAHHQKMMKKYGSRENILQCLNRKDNYRLEEINSKLSALRQRLEQLVDKRFECDQ